MGNDCHACYLLLATFGVSMHKIEVASRPMQSIMAAAIDGYMRVTTSLRCH